MTRVTTRYLTVLTAIAMSGAAFAGDGMMSSSDKIKKMDSNGDGQLSAAEHEAGARAMFAMMDSNKDGNVTAAEMDASHKMMMKDHSEMDHKDGMKPTDMKSSDMKSSDTQPKPDGN